jgi:hypothetical protein
MLPAFPEEASKTSPSAGTEAPQEAVRIKEIRGKITLYMGIMDVITDKYTN